MRKFIALLFLFAFAAQADANQTIQWLKALTQKNYCLYEATETTCDGFCDNDRDGDVDGDDSDCAGGSAVLVYWDTESDQEAVVPLTASMPDGDGARSDAAEYAGTYGFRCSGNGGRAVFTAGSTFDVTTQGYVGMWIHPSVADLGETRYLWQISNSTYDSTNSINCYVGSDEVLHVSIKANGTVYYANAANSTPYSDAVSAYAKLEVFWGSDYITVKLDGSTVASQSGNHVAFTNTFNVFGIANEFQYNTYGILGDYDNILISSDPAITTYE